MPTACRCVSVAEHGPYGGGIFIGAKGKLEINRYKFNSNPKEIAVELLKQVDVNEEEKKWNDAAGIWGATLHIQNWLDCIRTRQKPAADVEIGHRSISVAHLLNITRRLGARPALGPVQGAVPRRRRGQPARRSAAAQGLRIAPAGVGDYWRLRVPGEPNLSLAGAGNRGSKTGCWETRSSSSNSPISWSPLRRRPYTTTKLQYTSTATTTATTPIVSSSGV